MDGSNENNVRKSIKNVSIKYDNAFYLTIPQTLMLRSNIFFFVCCYVIMSNYIAVFISLTLLSFSCFTCVCHIY